MIRAPRIRSAVVTAFSSAALHSIGSGVVAAAVARDSANGRDADRFKAERIVALAVLTARRAVLGWVAPKEPVAGGDNPKNCCMDRGIFIARFISD